MKMEIIAKKNTAGRKITATYLQFLDIHIRQVIQGEAEGFLMLNEIAAKLFISHTHLTDTVQKETGNHPCYFYDEKIIAAAKKLLTETNQSAADIATLLTYDPSNFSKFFKKITGKTPGQFRKESKKR